MHDALLRDTNGLIDNIIGQVGNVNFFHEQWVRRSLPLIHSRIKAVKEGIQVYSEGWDPATAEEAAIVGNSKRNRRRDQGFGSGHENSEGKVSTVMP